MSEDGMCGARGQGSSSISSVCASRDGIERSGASAALTAPLVAACGGYSFPDTDFSQEPPRLVGGNAMAWSESAYIFLA